MDLQQENTERFDAIASEWDSDPRRVLMAQKIARAMRNALAPDGSVSALEFGAGTGLVTMLMAPKLGRVTALDGSDAMLEVLRQKCARKGIDHVTTIHGHVPNALPDAHYDLIYSSMTLHHIDDVPGLLRILAGHLNPGGRLALADLDSEDGTFHDTTQGIAHHGFARETFGTWLREAGFAEPQFSTAFTARHERDDGMHEYPIFLAIAPLAAS